MGDDFEEVLERPGRKRVRSYAGIEPAELFGLTVPQNESGQFDNVRILSNIYQQTVLG